MQSQLFLHISAQGAGRWMVGWVGEWVGGDGGCGGGGVSGVSYKSGMLCHCYINMVFGIKISIFQDVGYAPPKQVEK